MSDLLFWNLRKRKYALKEMGFQDIDLRGWKSIGLLGIVGYGIGVNWRLA